MITISFDFITLIIGICIGIIIGIFTLLFCEMRDGGLWSKGFGEGFNTKVTIEKLERIVKGMEDKK